MNLFRKKNHEVGKTLFLAGEFIDWSLIILASVAVAVCYGIYLGYADELIHSDIATEILTGREIFIQKTIFLKNYYHSTEIFLIRPTLFMALWNCITDNLMTTFRLAVITDIMIQIVCFFYMTRRLGLGYKASVFGILTYFGARTYASGEFTGLGNSSYGTVCAVTFLAIGYYSAASTGRVRSSSDSLMRFMMPVLSFLLGMSSMRFLATVLVPLVLAHSASKLWSRLPTDWTGDSVLRELAVWTVFCVIGLIFTSTMVVPKGFGPLPFQTLASNGLFVILSDNIPKLFLEIIKYNPVVLATVSFRPLSVAGATSILSAGFYVACAYAIARTSTPIFRTRLTVYRFLAVSLAIMSLTVMVTMDVIAVKLRYLVLAYLFMSLLISFLYSDLCRNIFIFARVILAVICSFIVLNNIHNLRMLPAVVSTNPSRSVVRHVTELEDALERHGVKRAYSLYWNSAVQTVLTNGNIEVWGVLGNMLPIRYLANYDVFAPEHSFDRSAFVNVVKKEDPAFSNMVQFSVINYDLLDEAVSKEIIFDPDGNIEIYYFARNPFVYPSGHNPADDYSGIELIDESRN